MHIISPADPPINHSRAANAARGTAEEGKREKIIIDKSMSVIRFVAYRAERLRLESRRREKSERDG